MTITQAAQRIRRIQRGVSKAARAADLRVARLALNDAKRYSSGTLSTTELRRLDHPYARRHGGVRVLGDPAFINRHGGEFFSAWHVIPSEKGFWLINNSRMARYMKGTRFMITRPIKARLYERANYMRRQLAKEELRKALRF